MNQSFSWKLDLRSKLLDGLLPGVAYYLLVMMVRMAVGPVSLLFGESGMLLLAFGLLAVSMFSFHRSLVESFSETTRGWYGMAGGMLAWWVAVITLEMDGKPLGGLSGILLLILAGLVLAQLWQRNLPTGGQFFLAALLLQWGGSLLVYYLTWLAERLNLDSWIQQTWGGIAIAAAVLIVGWMFARSQTRVQRTWAAVLAVSLLFASLGLL